MPPTRYILYASNTLCYSDNIPLRLRAVWPPCMLALLIATLGFMMHILRKAYLNAKMLRSNCLRLRMLYWVCMLSMLVKLATWFVLVVVLGVHWEHLESSNFEDISFLVFMVRLIPRLDSIAKFFTGMYCFPVTRVLYRPWYNNMSFL